MIRVTIYKNEKHECVGFKALGHAGYSENGQDVVCAAVSVLTINTVNAIEIFTQNEASLVDVYKRQVPSWNSDIIRYVQPQSGCMV